MKRIPILDYDIRQEFYKVAYSNRQSVPVTQTYETYLENNRDENAVIDNLVFDGLVTVLDPSVIFCPDETCSTVLNNKIIYRNASHINTTGAMLLWPLFEDFFKN